MATQDELARARILALRAPSQMQASPFVPASTGGRQNPLLSLTSGPGYMARSPFIPTGGRQNPLAGMKTIGRQPLPFPNQGVVRPTFPKPPVYKPPDIYRGPDTTIPPWLQRTDPYYGSPLDQKNETPWSEIPRWQKQPR